MGWVKNPIMGTEEIFNGILSEYGDVWNRRIGGSVCPYEYFADHLRDNYTLTLSQCDEVCRMIKKYYNIFPFYYTELKRV